MLLAQMCPTKFRLYLIRKNNNIIIMYTNGRDRAQNAIGSLARVRAPVVANRIVIG